MRHGAWRWTDPDTSEASAMTVDASAREYDVLRLLSNPKLRDQPINAWEMSVLLGWTIVSLSPRIAPLRRNGMIEERGRRPGPPPKCKSQIAYVITPRGLAFLSSAQKVH